MDIWVVAAAAATGYIAKYWHHISRDTKHHTSGLSSDTSFPDDSQNPSLIERIRDKTCPIKKLSRKMSGIGKEDHSDETSTRDDPLRVQVTEVDGYDIPEDSTWKLGAPRNKSQPRRWLHLQYINPRNSLDSCLMAQMHMEQAELEEYLLTPLSSPCAPTLRPFLVSDGKRIISRPSCEFMGGHLHKKTHSKTDNNNNNNNNNMVGVPCLPEINSAHCSEQKFNHENRMENSLFSSNIMQSDTQAGGSSGQALFCLGISIGILSTIIANKVEFEKLKFSLRQSENLVEDLQEELEMKDSLTVKELVNSDDLQDVLGISSSNEKFLSSEADMTSIIRHADIEPMCLNKDASISNIEAELEAELERLELCMKGSSMSSEDLIAELVHGELQADILRGGSSSEATLDRGSHSSQTLTPQSAKDGISPHELTLRLHDVIRSRLEEKIMELEAEVDKSHNQIKQLLTERSNHARSTETRNLSSQPLVMNLSGDALDAYNEAFEELNKIKGARDEPLEIRVDSPSSEQSREDRQTWVAGRRGEEAVPISITGIPSSEDSVDDCYDGSDDDDDDDDMMLIMQIVEKARQGSPAILRAQKAMVSLTADHLTQ